MRDDSPTSRPRASLGLLAAAHEAMPDGVVIVDGGGIIVHASRMVGTMLGWEVDQLRGQPVEVLIPRRFAHHHHHRTEYTRQPSPRPMGGRKMLTALHRQGHEVPVDIMLSPLDHGGETFVIAAIRDVAARRQAERLVRVFAQSVQSAACGVLITDPHGIIVAVNPTVCRLTGYSEEELLGKTPNLLKSGRHEPSFYRGIWDTIRSGGTWRGAIVNRRKDGTEYYEEQTISPVLSEEGVVSHYIAIKEDVTARVLAEQALHETKDELARRVAEIEALQEQLREQAIRDSLTGLYNRRHYDEVLPRELAMARRDHLPVCLLVLDLDRFKLINDTHGHLAGDQVIRALGTLLQRQCRRSDLVARYGGEEFVMLLHGSHLEDGLRRAEEIRILWQDHPVTVGGMELRPTLSVGVAQYGPPESADQFFRRADQALYQAKQRGRNQVIADQGDMVTQS